MSIVFWCVARLGVGISFGRGAANNGANGAADEGVAGTCGYAARDMHGPSARARLHDNPRVTPQLSDGPHLPGARSPLAQVTQH